MRTLIFLLAALLPLAGVISQKEKPSSPQPSASSESKPLVLDINLATEEDFAKLPGVGPELARRIVAYREKHGPFRRVEDLLVIRGIGAKKWKAMRPYLRAGSLPEKK